MTTDTSLRENTEIQGDILAGFKKDHICLLFLQFEDLERTRSWLEGMVPRIATNKAVARFNKQFSDARKSSGGDDPVALKATWLGLSLTYPGIQFLTGLSKPIRKVPSKSTLEAFVQGAAQRAIAMGDIDQSAPKQWLFGNDTPRTIHAVLTIASDTAEDLHNTIAEQRDAATRAGAMIVFQQDAGHFPGPQRGKEHFGFKDGVSEPAVAGFDEEDPDNPGYVKDHPGTRLIPAGEFVLGHPRVEVEGDRRGFPADAIPTWMENGSFQVIRRLAQDVPGWWAQVGRALEVLQNNKGAVPDNATVDWLAARLVGRWRSGAPVHKYPDQDPVHDPAAGRDNDISFQDDPEGHKTPLFSHLRQTAPRDGLVGEDGDLVAEEFMDARRIMRRGSPYGEPFDPLAGGARGPDGSRGLLFLSYQSDLVEQFEFIQKDWCNTADFPPARENQPGPDAMISGRLEKINKGVVHYESKSESGDKVCTKLDFSRFVHTEGALYTFVPSIGALKLLARGTLTKQPPRVDGVDEILPVPDRQRFARISQYWLLSGGEFRPISIADGGETTDLVRRPASTISTWPALEGVNRVDALLPIPDRQRIGGKSQFWLFHTVGGEQVYRIISIANGTHASAREAGDRPLGDWESLAGVSHVDAILPVPDLQRSQRKSWFWVFHTAEGTQRYRLISVADRPPYTDVQERRADDVLGEWQSLAGIDTVDAFLPVPAKQRANRQSQMWVFHRDQVRTISIGEDKRHTDTLVSQDRPLREWVTLG